MVGSSSHMKFCQFSSIFPVTILLTLSSSSYGQRAAKPVPLKVVVVDFDHQARGVESDICIDTNYPKCPSSARVGTTNANGEWTGRYSCGPQDKIFARPSDDGYYSSKPLPCMPMTLVVSSRRVVLLFTDYLIKEQADGAHGQAALVANDLAVRLIDVDPTRAAHFEAVAYESAGTALNVDEPTVRDPQQGRSVMSPALKYKITEFQIERQIYPSTDRRLGNLDYRTLSTLAGKSVGSILEDLSSPTPLGEPRLPQ